MKKKDVEAVAKWLHESFRQINGGAASWKELYPWNKNCYRSIAKLLLTDPPPCLRESVMKLEEVQ